MRPVMKSLLAAAAMMGIAGTAAADNTIVYANYLGTKHTTNKALEEFFADVEKDTNGSLTFDFHPAASLLGGKALPSGVRDGIADAGYLVGAYVPSEMPVDVYVGAFGIFAENPMVMSAVNADLVLLNCPECTAEYDKFNTYFFGTYALTPYLLQCVNEVKSLDDIKGLKVRGIGPWADMLRTLGAAPFNVSSNELYEALDRGTLDCASAALNWQRIRSLGEVAKNVIVDPGLGSFLGACTFCLRQEKWAELTQTEKDAILKHMPDVVAKATFNYIEDDIAVRKEYEEKGNNFYSADQDLKDAINAFKDNFRTEIVNYGKERNVPNPEGIAETAFKLIEKWEKLIGDKEWTRESYAQLLYDEVYSKVDYK